MPCVQIDHSPQGALSQFPKGKLIKLVGRLTMISRQPAFCIKKDGQGGKIIFDVAKTASFVHLVNCAIHLHKTMPSLNVIDLACDDLFCSA